MGADVSSRFTLDEGAAPPRLSIADFVGERGRARRTFERLWAECGPANGVAPRMRVCEILLQAIKTLELTPESYAQARRLLAKAFGGSLLPVTFQEALQLTQEVFEALEEAPPSLPAAAATSSTAPAASSDALAPSLGATPLDGELRPTSAGSRLAAAASGAAPAAPTASGQWWLHREFATRSDLESVNAQLCAQIAAVRGLRYRLVGRAEELRRQAQGQGLGFSTSSASSPSTRSGGGGGGGARSGAGTPSIDSVAAESRGVGSTIRRLEVAAAGRRLEAQRREAAALRAALEARAQRPRARRGVAVAAPPAAERAERESAEQRDAWALEAQAARGRVERKRGKCLGAEADVNELSRRLQAEHLRVVMLTSAMEREGHDVDMEAVTAEVALACNCEDLRRARDSELRADALASRLSAEAEEAAARMRCDAAASEAKCEMFQAELAELVGDSGFGRQAPSAQDIDGTLRSVLEAEVSRRAAFAQAAAQASALHALRKQGREARASAAERAQDIELVRRDLRSLEARLLGAEAAGGQRTRRNSHVHAEEGRLAKAELLELRLADQLANTRRCAALAACAAEARQRARRLASSLADASGALGAGSAGALVMSPQQEDLVADLEYELACVLTEEQVGQCRLEELLLLQKHGLAGSQGGPRGGESAATRLAPVGLGAARLAPAAGGGLAATSGLAANYGLAAGRSSLAATSAVAASSGRAFSSGLTAGPGLGYGLAVGGGGRACAGNGGVATAPWRGSPPAVGAACVVGPPAVGLVTPWQGVRPSRHL